MSLENGINHITQLSRRDHACGVTKGKVVRKLPLIASRGKRKSHPEVLFGLMSCNRIKQML